MNKSLHFLSVFFEMHRDRFCPADPNVKIVKKMNICESPPPQGLSEEAIVASARIDWRRIRKDSSIC